MRILRSIRYTCCILSILLVFFPHILFPQTIYELLREGTEESLRDACKERFLEETGTILELKKRLLDYEFRKNATPFSLRMERMLGEDIILIHADFAEYMKDEDGSDLILLSGDVNLSFKGKRIRGDRLSINADKLLITGSGNVTFVEGQKVYEAESFYYNAETDEGTFFNAKASINRFVYTGPVIQKVDESGKFIAEDVSITTCELKNPHYRVEADELYVYDEELVLIKNASFYYGSDPVFVFPYFYRNLNEPAVRSALFFRQRSGIVSQNTYYPLKGEEKSLKLMGDFYERLGVYLGTEYSSEKAWEKRSMISEGADTGSSTGIGVSAVLSNDVYYYDDVTENWSPLGPPAASEFGIKRYMRYRAGFDQNIRFGGNVQNVTELNLFWVSDPYYEYDFERRKERLDLFDLIGQAGYDEPRKGDGFKWQLNNTLTSDSFLFSVKNSARFVPQLNTDKYPLSSPDNYMYVSLPDYYENRIYSMTAPDVMLSHSETLFNRAKSVIFSDLDYRSSLGYSHSLYYDPTGSPSSEIHKGSTNVGVQKEYALARYVKFIPDIELGAQLQQHVDSSSSQLTDDRQNSLLYGRARENLTVGSSNLYLQLFHDLKYKLYGPDDDFMYGDFRVHDLGVEGYAGSDIIKEKFTTSVDLRPVYNWTTGSYETLSLERERFSPFINTLTFTPFPSLSMIDKLVYEISRSRFKLNSFILNYESSALNLAERPLTLSWELNWQHYFVNPVLDTLRSTFGVSAQVHPYWKLYLSVISRNDDFWKYYKSGAEKINPLVDLLKSFNFFNIEDRKDSNFKLKGISIGFVHDLHDWEMKLDYSGRQELSPNGSKYIWNNTYTVSIGLKDVKSLNIHTQFSERRE